MGIKKFNDFVNASVAVNESHTPKYFNEVYDKINKPFGEFIENVEQRTNYLKETINDLLQNFYKKIEEVMDEFSDVIVGEPQVDMGYDLSDVSVFLETNVPNTDEAWEDNNSPAMQLEDRIIRYFGTGVEIHPKPTKEGNCKIEVSSNFLDESVFGKYTDTFMKMGE